MQSKANFFKFSVAFLVVTLIVIAGFGSTNVQAGPLAQETAEATMEGGMMGDGMACPPGYTEMSGAMMGGGMEATMEATMDHPTMESTMEATMEGGDMSGDLMEGQPCALAAILSGAAEVPGPGDDDGAGVAFVTVDSAKSEICYTIMVGNITLPASAAHIHKGNAGEAGDVVVPFTAPDANGAAEGCATVEDHSIIDGILSNPTGYYVNVHTTDLPKGAVRGQLMGAVTLSGAEEVPGPGDEDGWGYAAITVDAQSNQVCYVIWAGDIALPATGAHIHKAARGEAGDVVVPLTAPDENGIASGCATPEDTSIVGTILSNPELYYVNVHTEEFKAGAIRGQLK